MRISLRGRARSFVYAFRGVHVLIMTQHSAWIHLLATIVVIVAGFVFRVTSGDWCWLVVAMAAVWSAEAFNTALEFLADEVSQEKRERIGKAKDLGAAAVLFAAIGAAVIGAIVFAPYVIGLAR